MPNDGPHKRSDPIIDLLDLWNQQFFLPRAAELSASRSWAPEGASRNRVRSGRQSSASLHVARYKPFHPPRRVRLRVPCTTRRAFLLAFYCARRTSEAAGPKCPHVRIQAFRVKGEFMAIISRKRCPPEGANSVYTAITVGCARSLLKVCDLDSQSASM